MVKIFLLSYSLNVSVVGTIELADIMKDFDTCQIFSKLC